jgi:hypothetical protein
MILSFGVVLDDGDALPIDLNRRSANRGSAIAASRNDAADGLQPLGK